MDAAPRLSREQVREALRRDIQKSPRQLDVATSRSLSMCFTGRGGPEKRPSADFHLAESAADDLCSWFPYSKDCFRITKHRVFEQDTGGWSARAKPRSSSCFRHSMGTQAARGQSEPFA
jgi:hypothetical protein